MNVTNYSLFCIQDLSAIPIEIAANKLLDWLISRQHCTKDWPEKIAIVRQKINEALQDMPQNDTLAKILFEASRKNVGDAEDFFKRS